MSFSVLKKPPTQGEWLGSESHSRDGAKVFRSLVSAGVQIGF
jgi:hypothetical protein